MCLLWGDDLKLQLSWQMSPAQDSRKTWLATGSLLTVWWRMRVSGWDGPVLSGSSCHTHGCLSLVGGRACRQPASSALVFAQSFVLLSKRMSRLSGYLVSSASIQKLFCGSCSAFKWSFDEFGENVVSPFYSSAILGPPPTPGSCLYTRLASLGFLVGTFNPFIFRIFIDIYAPIGEGNSNPLQYSSLENPRDGGAWWAAFYWVAESQTRLKGLSNSCSSMLLLPFS